MSCTRNTFLIRKYLEDQLEKVRESEALNGIRNAIIKPDSYLQTWTFVKQNWNKLFSRYFFHLTEKLSIKL